MKVCASISMVVLSSIATIGLFSSPANASEEYLSASGTNYLKLDVTKPVMGGDYTVPVNGKYWRGLYTITQQTGTAQQRTYSGTFEDRLASGDNKCSGDITLVRTPGKLLSSAIAITWKVKGGTDCPSIGSTFKMTLATKLSYPDAKGDFSQNWPIWRVASADGKLNCRKSPNGPVLRVLPTGMEVRALFSAKTPSPIVLLKDEPWLLLDLMDSCYVRANSRYIIPVPSQH